MKLATAAGSSGNDLFEVYDMRRRKVGVRPRRICHSTPGLVHRSVHVLVFRPGGELILQKRSMNKDVQPGKWDTSVGGHLDRGETYLGAALREAREELGIEINGAIRLYRYFMKSEIETEDVVTFRATHSGNLRPSVDEIEEVREWGMDEIKERLGTGLFTPNFEQEYEMYERCSHSRPMRWHS